MLSNLDVENVFVYIADAVRWDFAPDDIVNRGTAVKTVAAGIHSPTSIASIISGTHPPQHNVAQFSDSLPEGVPNLLTIPSLTTAFVNSINHVRIDADGTGLISETLRTDESPPSVLSEIDSPFVLVERGPGGHAPYGDFEGDGWEYFEARSEASRSTLATEHRTAIEKDTDWFRSRLADLERRGLLDDTLVIYTSDHGELIGEAGMLSHSPPIHRKHVHVPTVFIHPSLDRRLVTDRVLRHVDLAPTVASSLDIEFPTAIEPIGRDLTTTGLAEHGATFHTVRKPTPFGTLDVSFDSVWDPTGGYVFPRTDRAQRLLFGLYQLARSPWKGYARRHALEYVTAQIRSEPTRGPAGVSIAEAERSLRRIKDTKTSQQRPDAIEVDTDSLRQLGYIE